MMMPTQATIIHLDSTTATTATTTITTDGNYDNNNNNNNNNYYYISIHRNTKLLTIPHVVHNE